MYELSDMNESRDYEFETSNPLYVNILVFGEKYLVERYISPTYGVLYIVQVAGVGPIYKAEPHQYPPNIKPYPREGATPRATLNKPNKSCLPLTRTKKTIRPTK